MSPKEIISLLDRYCSDAASKRYNTAVEDLPAGKEIVRLPSEDLRQVFLAIYGRLVHGVQDFHSRWGTGLEHMNEDKAIQQLHAKIAIMDFPLNDADFCAIISSTDGFERWAGQFSYLLRKAELCLEGSTPSEELQHWLGQMRSAIMNVYEAFAGDELEQERQKIQMDRIDAILAGRAA